MRVVRLAAAERRIVPWKNGGGVTEEIAVHPSTAGFEDFQWRISMARVERGGPFSRFPGVDRVLAVLEGRMRLAVEGRRAVELSPSSAPLAFPGDVAVEAALIEPVRDLNVMCRRGAFRAELRRCAGECTVAGQAFVLLAFAATHVRGIGDGMALAAGDALLIEEGGGARLRFDAPCHAVSLYAWP